MKGEMQLAYPVISDDNAVLAKQFRVYNAADGKAFPSVIVLSQDEGQGVAVKWAYVGVNASDRPDTDVIIAQALRIQKSYVKK